MVTPTTQTEVVRAVQEDLLPASAALARAFQDDPVASWVIPDPDHRRALLPRSFELFTEAFLRHDETYVVADRSGAALWTPPGVSPVPEEEAEEFQARAQRIAGPHAGRLFELLSLMEEHHPEEPAHYLGFVGVVPEQRGRGLGRALLVPVLELCDDSGVSAYLEATSERNRPLYERLGFEVISEIRLPGGPSLWPMWRTPK